MINWKKMVLLTQLTLIGSLMPLCVNADSVGLSNKKLASLVELSKQPPASRHLNIQEWTTQAGSKVLFMEAHELPMFDLSLTFAAGSSRDGDKFGIAFFTNAMLNEGVKGLDATAIANKFDEVGAVFGNGSYRDMAVVSLRSLSQLDKRQKALDVFVKILGEPSFPADSLERLRNQLLTSFEIQKKTPSSLLNKAFYQHLYGNHPYAHAYDGTPETIKAMKIKDLQAFYQKAYSAKNAVIAIVGDLSKEEAARIAERASAALPTGDALTAVEAPQMVKSESYHIDFPSNQTHIILGQLGVTRTDPDFAALYLGNQILGGSSLSSRLMKEVRERRGLTYGIYSGFSTMQAAGPFSISVQTRAEMTDGTLVLIKQLTQDFLRTGPTQKEVDDAKQEIIGSYPLSNASNSNIVAQLGAIGFYHLPLTYLEDFVKQIEALTPDQVQQTMAKHLNLDNFIVVTVGPKVKQEPLPAPTEAKQKVSGVPEH